MTQPPRGVGNRAASRFEAAPVHDRVPVSEALRRILPPEITDWRKGFNMPVAKWLVGPLRELVADTLSETRLRRDGFFRPGAVRNLLDEDHPRRRDHRKLIWTLLIFQFCTTP